MILLGVEKIGKSTFAASSDRPMFIQVKGEEGIDDLAVSKTPTAIQCTDELFGWMGALRQQEHNHGTLVVDSSSALEPLIHRQTCVDNNDAPSIEKVGGGYGKGYTEALKYWRWFTDGLDILRTERNMASIVIGHVKVKRFDDPAGDSYDQYQWDIHEKAANLMYRWADLILFCNTKVVVKKEDVGFNKEKARGIDLSGGRFLFTQKRPAHPGGGRGAFGKLPYELPLDWSAFVNAVQMASQSA
jgi:hypothetical protein